MNISVTQAKKMLDEGKTMVVYDTETTGLNKQTDRILSFSAIKICADGDSFKELERKDIFINPEMHIPETVTAINHIDDLKVAGCPTEKECAKEIIDFLNSADIVAGYNQVSFDDCFINNMSKRVLKRNWEANAEIDVMNIAKAKLKKGASGEVVNHKLATVAEYLNAGEGLTFHNSIDDVIATARVFWKLKDMFSEPKVTAIILWEKFSMKRLYINNTENISLYYDLVPDEWIADPGIEKSFIENLLSDYDGIEGLIECTRKNGGRIYL